MKKQNILAIDIGTTNCKVLILDQSCNILAKTIREYSVSIPKPGWSEQSPQLWWDAVRESVREIVSTGEPESIAAIGLCGQMHGLVLMDKKMSILRHAILWNDQRSAAHCKAAYKSFGTKAEYFKRTNNALLPGYVGGKLLWLKDNEPELYSRISKLMMPKDYIRYLLCGEIATDFSDASGTGIFDVVNREWPEDLLKALDISIKWLPEVHAATELSWSLTEQAASELGLPKDIPVAYGGGDAVTQTLGCGIIEENKLLIVLGTGGNVTLSTRLPKENPEGAFQSFAHVLPNRWVAMGVTLTAGNSLKWYRDTLASEERSVADTLSLSPYELLEKEAAQSPVGSNGVMFLPYLQGERCPHVDADVRGTFLGLGLYSNRNDMVRSVLEGVAMSLRDAYEYIGAQKVEEICLSGGGASSALWRQIHADLFNADVITYSGTEDAGAIGAGIIGGLAVDLWKKPEDAIKNFDIAGRNTPLSENVEKYSKLFEQYRRGYPALKQFKQEN